MQQQITVQHALPSEIVCLSSEAIVAMNTIIERAERALFLGITGEDTFHLANQRFKDLHTIAKELEASRLEVKAPVVALGKAIDAAAATYADRIDRIKRALGGLIKGYQDGENIRREAERLKAEQEARRLQAELEAQAEFERPPDAPILDVPQVPLVKPAETPAPLKSAVRTVKKYEVIVDEVGKIPRYVSGIALMKPDLKAIEQIMRMGGVVEGCRLIEIIDTAATGRG